MAKHQAPVVEDDADYVKGEYLRCARCNRRDHLRVDVVLRVVEVLEVSKDGTSLSIMEGECEDKIETFWVHCSWCVFKHRIKHPKKKAIALRLIKQELEIK